MQLQYQPIPTEIMLKQNLGYVLTFPRIVNTANSLKQVFAQGGNLVIGNKLIQLCGINQFLTKTW